jgi:3-oxoacyl-[acyl-carrier-protein] synthase II
MTTPVSIHRVGVVSPLGIGFEAFSAALRGRHRPAPPDAAQPGVPAARRVDGFNAADHLGRNNVASLNRMSQLAIAATAQALAGDADLSPERRRATGVVLGSSAGPLENMTALLHTTYTEPLPYLVSARQFTTSTVNCAASACAIWHGLKGINASVCAGELSGLAALQYAVRMLQGGHAACLLAGAVEEYSDFMALMQGAQGEVPFAEGGAVFLLRRDAAPGTALATVLGIRTRVLRNAADGHQARDALARAIGALLASVHVRAADLRWWCGHQAGGDGRDAAGCAALEALAALRAPAALVRVPDLVGERCGNSQGAATALLLAGALALAPAGLGLVTAVSPQGMLACVLIDRHAPGARPARSEEGSPC